MECKTLQCEVEQRSIDGKQVWHVGWVEAGAFVNDDPNIASIVEPNAQRARHFGPTRSTSARTATCPADARVIAR
jgi:hypothetical protein